MAGYFFTMTCKMASPGWALMTILTDTASCLYSCDLMGLNKF